MAENLSYSQILNAAYDDITESIKVTTGGSVVTNVGTVSSVSSSASNQTLLASNTDRRGAAIYNASTSVLYVKFGATASTSSFTIKMSADSYYEVPFGYTGRIDGIWASANGAALVTEFTGS